MLKDKEKKILFFIFLIVLFYVGIEHFEAVKKIVGILYEAISPLIYGVVIAFILNLIVVWLERHMTQKVFRNHTFKRTISITVSILILSGAITIVCFNVIPGIVDSVKRIAERAPQAIEEGMLFLENYLGISEEIIETVQNFELNAELVNNMFGLIDNESVIEAIKASGNVVGSIFSVFAKFFIGLFFAFYILANKEAIEKSMKQLIETYLPEKIANGIEHFGYIVYNTYANFISGQCMDAIILGCLMSACMGIMGLPYAVLVGVLISVTALIPVVGAFFGGTIGVILLIMESPLKALTFLILFLVLQQIDNRLIYPNIVGNAIGIPSILIFAAIIVGGEFGGVIGMFLGIPFTAVFYTIIVEDMERRKKEKEKIIQNPKKKEKVKS